MPSDRYTVLGHAFHTKTEYEAALRDLEIINELKKDVNMEKVEDVIALFTKLQSGNIQFESSLGRDFDDDIYEKIQELKKSGKYKTVKIADENISNKAEVKRNKNKDNADNKENKFNKVNKFNKANKTNKVSQVNKENKENKQKVKKEKINLNDLDEGLKNEIIRQLKLREKRRKAIIFLMSLLALACFGYFGYDYYNSWSNQMEANSLSQLVDQQGDNSENTDAQVKINMTSDDITVPDVLQKYQTLYIKNKTLIGWLKIDDTIIDYPVMQTIDNEYYLSHNFDQETDKNGCLFLDTSCNVLNRSTNLIIYGHSMKSGKMFGTLEQYKDKSYCDKHPYINFDTIYEEGTYQVMYVFRSKIYNEEDIVFKYYQFYDAQSKEEFDSDMSAMDTLSLYDTGVTASYGDQLLTLSTCDYYETDGRFVVVAKRVK